MVQTRTESVHIYIHIYIYTRAGANWTNCREYTHAQYVTLTFEAARSTSAHSPTYTSPCLQVVTTPNGNPPQKLRYDIVLAGTASMAHMRTGHQVTDCGLFCARVFTVIIPYIPGAEINRTVSCFLVHSKICPTSYEFLSVYSFCFSTALSHQCF